MLQLCNTSKMGNFLHDVDKDTRKGEETYSELQFYSSDNKCFIEWLM